MTVPPGAGPPTVDVIVVGGGLSGGLPAAAYLQKAGLQVLILEANAELGSFCCTHETWPQTLDSPHVGVSHPLCADTRTPVPGLYLGGGGVHPGVPGLLGAGMLAAEAMRADHGLADPPVPR
jgi:phytoene dehydrogenase-like protein